MKETKWETVKKSLRMSRKRTMRDLTERPIEVLVYAIFIFGSSLSLYLIGNSEGWDSEEVRNVIYIVVGLGALYGLSIRSQQLDVGRKAQVTDTLTRAVDQLGDEKISIRCAGISLLQRVAEEDDHNLKNKAFIADIMMHFIRYRARRMVDNEESLGGDGIIDIQTALQMLGEIITYSKSGNIDSEFGEINLDRLNFERIVAKNVNFKRYSLQDVEFGHAKLNGAHFNDADLCLASFESAILDNAHLQGAHLSGSNLSSAHLCNAHLERAHLGGVKVWDAVFMGATFDDTDCDNVDFSHVRIVSQTISPSDQVVEGPALEKHQVGGMIYLKGFPPKLPNGWDEGLLELGAYEYEDPRDSSSPRRLVHNGRWIDPPRHGV